MLWCQIHCLAEQLFIFFLVIIWLLYVFANENCLLTRSITIITMFQMFNSVKPWEWFWCVYSSSTHLKALDLGYIFSFTFYHYWPCLPLPFLIRLNFCCCYISYLDHCSYNSSYNLFFPSVFSKNVPRSQSQYLIIPLKIITPFATHDFTCLTFYYNTHFLLHIIYVISSPHILISVGIETYFIQWSTATAWKNRHSNLLFH